jgi:elongation factor 1-gamma
LVGERITLADVFVGSALAFAFANVISAADRKKVPNVVRYYETYVTFDAIWSLYCSYKVELNH